MSDLLRKTLDEEVKTVTKQNVLAEKKIDKRAMPPVMVVSKKK